MFVVNQELMHIDRIHGVTRILQVITTERGGERTKASLVRLKHS